MASIEVPRCRGCGSPVPPSSAGRRLLTGSSSSQVVSTWKNLLHEKLEVLNLSVDDEVSRSGFMCRKCFRSFQSFSDMKNRLLECINEAFKYMNTFPKSNSLQDSDDAAPSVSLLGKLILLLTLNCQWNIRDHAFSTVYHHQVLHLLMFR